MYFSLMLIKHESKLEQPTHKKVIIEDGVSCFRARSATWEIVSRVQVSHHRNGA
jgi:hypothetical protein